MEGGRFQGVQVLQQDRHGGQAAGGQWVGVRLFDSSAAHASPLLALLLLLFLL